MGIGEVIGIMFVVVSVLLLGLEWLSKMESVETAEQPAENRGVVRYRARR